MDEVSLNAEPAAVDDEPDEFEIEGDCSVAEYMGQTGVIQGENLLPPSIGMEFETYEDVYYFYNCYAKEQGFGVRVSNTWYRKSKERYRGKLSCSSAGFKKKTEANRPRPETRTGCPAMIKFRLMENKRWRIIEVELDHNHLISPMSGKFYKSHKHLGLGTKRALPLDGPEEAQKIRLFQTVVIDANANETLVADNGEIGNKYIEEINQLKLKEGDAEAIQNFFSRSQLMDPNFFYVMDINEKGCLRNLFWIESRSRAAYGYFCDVITIDTKCLTKKFEVPLVLFVGMNHHSQPLLLGCGLVAGETLESYTWLFRAWLTCMLGRPPQAIVTDHCKYLQTAVADVFPRASHCISLSTIMQKLQEELGELYEYEAMKAALDRAVYYSSRPEEFEAAWEDIVKRYGIGDNNWIQTLYEYRKRWVPVYAKETFLAGLFLIRQNEESGSFLEGFLDKSTSLEDFLDKHDQLLQKIHHEETLADMDSKNSSLVLKSRSCYELQLLKLYTNEILRRFEREVEGMYSCFNTRQVKIDGPIATYMVKEQMEADGDKREIIEFEVFLNAADLEIVCICGLFNSRGYLCRHALTVLNQNGIKEIPLQCILSRWRKDIKRNYSLDHCCSGIDVNNALHRYDHLYKCIVRVVEEGQKSQDRYKVTLQALDEILGKLHLVENHQE